MDNLQFIFQQKFNADTWQTLLINFLGKEKLDLRQIPEVLDNAPEKTDGYFLGKKILADNLELGLFYYKISAGSVVHRCVGLQKLVHTFSKWVFDAVLVVFDDDENWRLSLVCDIRGEATAAKRFTFVFGDATQYYHTAVERFLKLQSDDISLNTLKDAFSVEVLSKGFYKELFAWYEWASKPEMMVSYSDGKTEEHLIRLITRLMFVWFIKQKNLVTEDIFEEEKLKEILVDFDTISSTKGNYYNAILQNLFFATLNRPINEREFACEGGGRWNEEYGIKTKFRDVSS